MIHGHPHSPYTITTFIIVAQACFLCVAPSLCRHISWSCYAHVLKVILPWALSDELTALTLLLAGGPQALASSLNFTSYSWRPSSASHLASLGYSEIVGTLEPLAVPTRKPDASITSSWYPTATPAVAASVAADNGCTIFVGPSVQVYYFPDSTSTTNTKCFTGEAGSPSPMPLGHHQL